MKVNDQLSIQEFDGKRFQARLVEPDKVNESKAVITHYLHNLDNGVSKFFQEDAEAAIFVYEIVNVKLSPGQIERINSISNVNRVSDIIQEIHRLEGELKYLKIEQSDLKNNLILLESKLPEILSQLLLIASTKNLSLFRDLCEKITEINPLNLDQQFSHPFYEYKIKRFLTVVANGVELFSELNPKYFSTLQNLTVNNEFTLLGQFQNQVIYENYLLENTELETGYKSRDDLAKLFLSKDGKLLIKFNLRLKFV